MRNSIYAMDKKVWKGIAFKNIKKKMLINKALIDVGYSEVQQ